MRDGSLICIGKGNTDWNCSAHMVQVEYLAAVIHTNNHMEDFESSMNGIYSESINEFTRDEAPMVYKPAEAIIVYWRNR